MKPLVELTKDYMGSPYCLGSNDCFSLIYDYMGKVGVDLPEEWEGLTLLNYAQLFEDDPKEAKDKMIEFVGTVANEIPVGMAFAGDILLLRLKESSDSLPFLAIHGGQTMCIAASKEYGVRAWSLEFYTIERVWRCRK